MSKTWEDAIGMVSDCKVVAKPQVIKNGTEIQFLLEDPAGQKWALQIIAKATPALSGNIMTLVATFEINAIELQPGDKFGDHTF